MTALIVVLAVLILLLILPLGVRVIYDESGVWVWAVAGRIRFRVYPTRPKTEKATAKAEAKAAAKQRRQEAKQAKKEKKNQQQERAATDNKPAGALVKEFLPLVKVGVRAIGGLRTVFTVEKLTVRVTYGGADAAAAAMNYGVAWSAIGAGMAVLTKTFRIKKQDVQAELDYDCKELRVTADASVTLTLARVFGFLFHYGFEALRVWQQNRKGGAKT